MNKPMLSCYISKELVADKKLNAGQVVRELGKYIQGGGGQPFFATAGGKKCRRYSRGIKQGSRVREVVLS
jgi:alanyl-tRNA synthetase